MALYESCMSPNYDRETLGSSLVSVAVINATP